MPVDSFLTYITYVLVATNKKFLSSLASLFFPPPFSVQVKNAACHATKKPEKKEQSPLS